MVAELFLAAAFSLVSGADEALLYDSLAELKSQHHFKRIWGLAILSEMGAAAIGAVIGGYLYVCVCDQKVLPLSL